MNDDNTPSIVERPTIPALMASDARLKGDQIVIAVCVRVEHFNLLRRFRGKEVDLVLAQTEIGNTEPQDDQTEFPEDEGPENFDGEEETEET